MYETVSCLRWDMDADTISGMIVGKSSTVPFNFDKQPGQTLINKLWDMMNESLGVEW